DGMGWDGITETVLPKKLDGPDESNVTATVCTGFPERWVAGLAGDLSLPEQRGWVNAGAEPGGRCSQRPDGLKCRLLT
ncbi:MAG: hypothetical protein RLZZ436_4582, partial [Planctomycetota bacterium]